MSKFLQLNAVDIGYQKTLVSSIQAGLDFGDVCLLIGNNGVGKTTLIKSILHHIPTLKGEIQIQGKSQKKHSIKEIAKQIAVVFSKANIPAHYTTFDLISLGKFIHLPFYYQLKRTDEEEINSIIAQLQLEEFKHTLLTNLSDGNLQKAYIGRALAQNSPMIILDEPTTHLDEENKVMILKLLRNLAKNHNKIILFSSHDWRLAKEFADNIWLIHDGQFQEGLAEDILLKNDLLTHPRLFTLSDNFVSPIIEAPFLEKEMLYSGLQKNFKIDLSSFKIILEEKIWVLHFENVCKKCHSVEELINSIKTLL